MEGAGGVGGLLCTTSYGAETEQWFPAYDGNGNVMAMVNSSSCETQVRFEYDPFGNEIRSTGPALMKAKFRFSTKYTDSETGGIVSYQRRPYQPSTGRWLSRDPVQENGGVNLYGFIDNSPANYYDFLGLDVRIENTMQVSGFHQRVTVDTWDDNCTKTGTYSISFGIDGEQPGSSSQGTDSSGGGSSGSLGGGSGSGSKSGNGSGGGPGSGSEDGSGIVYVDTDAALSVADTYKTSCCTDRKIILYLAKLVGNRGHYSILSYNCRTFSRQQFERIKAKFPTTK